LALTSRCSGGEFVGLNGGADFYAKEEIEQAGDTGTTKGQPAN